MLDELKTLKQIIEGYSPNPGFDESLFDMIVKKIEIIDNATIRFMYNDNVRRISGALVPTINCQGIRIYGVSSSYRSSLLHSIRTRVHLFCLSLTNKYWMNTYFFSGGFAVKCVFWYKNRTPFQCKIWNGVFLFLW